MDSQLQSISKIFTERLYRIPDYQRGYAWTEKQLKDFWSDIVQLEEGTNHYVGVLTLEQVPKTIYTNWEDDNWIITSKSYEPYYVVDGQQRLTTTIIFIQAITEIIDPTIKLNYTSIGDIRKKYIFDSKDEGISRSYIFGYEKDNPSYEFLKTKIFGENSGSNYKNTEETIYTHNLEFAKNYFCEKLKQLTNPEIEILYRKATQNLLFNIYSITSDIDVFIAFETMNNRGKPLSNLELLKNRLIYLSTKFKVDNDEKNKLRKEINDSWKSIYHYLGKNKNNPLDDDLFLMNHFLMYFSNELKDLYNNSNASFSNQRIHRLSRDTYYVDYLLEKKFTAKNIIDKPLKTKQLTLLDVYDYAANLQKSVKLWYDLFNPTSSKNFNDEEKLWLEKLARINIVPLLPLLLTFYINKPKKSESLKLLKLLEKYSFLRTLGVYFESIPAYLMTYKSSHKTSNEDIIKEIQTNIDKIISAPDFVNNITYRLKSRGFYEWPGIKYFLYEYDLFLQKNSKNKKKKINWETFNEELADYITVEHIYPQNAKFDCWGKFFDKFTQSEKKKLLNSAGNLLPLSIPKNSSLQNKCFKDKVDNGNNVGYRYGSYSENEISHLEEWTADEILKRGLKLLKFMEERWEIKLGDEDKKIEILNLKFLKQKQQNISFD